MVRSGLIHLALLVMLCLPICAADGVAGAIPAQSFEQGMPASIRVHAGNINLSDIRAQDGEHSLRWDWVPGDVLTITTGSLGDIATPSGYGGYLRPAFRVQFYNDVPQEGALTVRWMAGERSGGNFEFPLIFKGWQKICYHYNSNSRLRDRQAAVLSNTDRIEVLAPANGKGGTIFIDCLELNKPVDYREAREGIKALWEPFVPARSSHDAALVARASADEATSISRLEATLDQMPSRVVGDQDVAKLEKRVIAKYNLVHRSDGNVTGKCIPNFSSSVGIDLLEIARTWSATTAAVDPKPRLRLESLYFLLDDFFRDCGAVAQGSMDDLNWYGGRNHGTACFLMREPLRRTGRLARVLKCLKFHWNYDSIFELPTERRAMGTDYFYIDTHYLMRIALMHDSADEVAIHLRAFVRRYNCDLMNTVEPDDSIYHHGFYNFPYVSGSLAAIAEQIKQLAPTSFAVSRESFDRIKQAAMAMRWFCNLTDAPISMHGRHPGRMGLVPAQFLSLAEAGRTYNAGRFDVELASAYLRLVPAQADKPEFISERIAPEPSPVGNHALNYAALMGHRRSEWLAVVRGYSRYLPAQESYANANRHGLFLGNGCLDILASGSPINLVASGCDVANGWDWCHLDGATTFDAPLSKIANGNGTLSEKSDQGFVGGLSHGNRNGVFVMSLHSQLQYRKALPDGMAVDPKASFTASKSYFFFDRRLVCLGSGIALQGSTYPVHTTLFQKHLPSPGSPIIVDAQPVTAIPWRNDVSSTEAHTLMDTQNTGYFVPAGQRLHVRRDHLRSRDGHDEKDTSGDAAIAYLDHGTTPQDERYAYIALPRTDAVELAQFASAMTGPNHLVPVLIRQQDRNAHVVLDRGTRTWAGIFFSAQAITTAVDGLGSQRKDDPVLPLVGVAQSCLVMCEGSERDRIKLTICDPDLHLDSPATASTTLHVELEPGWHLADNYIGVSEKAGKAGGMVISITSREARSYTMFIKR